MSKQSELRQKITDRIVKSLEKGVPPWRRPWQPFGLPVNVASGNAYRGINILLLSLRAQELDVSSNVWGTLKQWNDLGCSVKKRPADVPPGEWGSMIVYYQQVEKVVVDDDGEEEEVTFPVLRTYTVFNADQVTGPAAAYHRTVPRPVAPFATAEKVITATGAAVRTGGDRAFYNPAEDFIHCPERDRFVSTESYYGTMFHELCHWAGHESRLARLNKFARFGSEAYALEELVAELGGVFLVGHVGLPLVELEQHASYLDSWLRCLEQDARAIFQASAAASAAADYILAAAGITVDAKEPQLTGV
jgi:antirestriction protein ArdC